MTFDILEFLFKVIRGQVQVLSACVKRLANFYWNYGRDSFSMMCSKVQKKQRFCKFCKNMYMYF